MISKNELSVLSIIKYMLNNEKEASRMDIDDWSVLYEELKVQSLLPVTYTWAKQSDVPKEIFQQWTIQFASQSYLWYRYMEEQKQLLDLLKKNGYLVAIIKGCASGIYYPQPQLRVSSDIDFLVCWDDYDKIYKLLVQSGYTSIDEKDEKKHHQAFCKNNIIFEMHKRPGGTRISGKYANQDLIYFFQQGLKEIETVNCIKYDIPMLPILQNAMVFLLHTEQHMKEGLGLRHILDWMMFVKENVDDLFWYNQLERWAKKGHVDLLAKIMTRMCQKYMGLRTDITWANDADETACDQLMKYVFQQGDFGIKAGKNDTEIRLLAESQSNGGFWRRLNTSSLYSMPIAQKYKLLKPLALIYQLFRYMVKWFNRKHPIRTFLSNKKEGKERAELFQKLGLRSK